MFGSCVGFSVRNKSDFTVRENTSVRQEQKMTFLRDLVKDTKTDKNTFAYINKVS